MNSMEKMTRSERLKAAIASQEVDRLPVNMWLHKPDVDQDPVALAEDQIYCAKEYGFDFIKMMPFGNYAASDYGLSCTYFCTKLDAVLERKWGIQCLDDYKRVVPKPGYFGTHGKVLMIAQELQRQLKGEDIPYIQTIFSPITNLKKLAGPRVIQDMREHPEIIHAALEAFTETTIDFIKLNIEAGVSGFFFASQCSTTDLMTEAEYDEFGVKYDLKLFDAMKDCWFNVVHIHGENTMWDKLAQYPAQCINWHDRWVAPTMAEARKKTNKFLMGGINEAKFADMTPGEVKHHVQEAVDILGGNTKGVILSPGCVAHTNTPEINYYALRMAVENL